MSLRNKVAWLLHGETFHTGRFAVRGLKRKFADEQLQRSFAIAKCPLSTNPRVETINCRRWRLGDANRAYLIKDVGDRLAITRERVPSVCRIAEFFAFQARPRFFACRWRLQQASLQCLWTAEKHLRDRPRQLMVNIGAGSWYVPNWKTMDLRGPWYNFYLPGFIDFNYDLTSNEPFPFGDEHVHLFYCEHVIEHLHNRCCEHLFQEALRCLEPGGGLRIVVPDADLLYDRLRNRDAEFYKSWMDRDNSSLEEAFCTLVAQSRDLDKADMDQRLATMAEDEFLDWCEQGLNYDAKRAGEHINWFNFQKLARMLKEAGFGNVCRTNPQESRFCEARGPSFDTRPWYSLHVDCAKS